MNKYGEVVSEELKQTIADIKKLPEDKILEAFQCLNYVFIGNIIYFGYQNHCYNLEQMRFLFNNLKGVHGCHHYDNYDDYVALANQMLDKMGLTEEAYKKYKDQILVPFKIESLKRYMNLLEKLGEPLPNKYKDESRNKLAYMDYISDNYTPFEILEGISENGFYNNMLVFEDGKDYRRLEAYYETEYAEEYLEAFHKSDFVFGKMIEQACPSFKKQFRYEKIRRDKSTIFIGKLKIEETDIEDNLDYEDEIIVYSNDILCMTELAYHLSKYYGDIEQHFEYREEEEA